jgi:hypothetical protein
MSERPTLYTFTNQENVTQMGDILAMFYMGVANNQLGVMQAFNIEKGETELVLVGVQLDEDGKPDCYPLAKVLAAEDTLNYLAPDGKGGFYDLRNPSDVSEAKDSMRSYEEAVIDVPESVDEGTLGVEEDGTAE